MHYPHHNKATQTKNQTPNVCGIRKPSKRSEFRVRGVVAEEEKTKKEEMEWPLEPRLRHGSGIRYLQSQDM